ARAVLARRQHALHEWPLADRFCDGGRGRRADAGVQNDGVPACALRRTWSRSSRQVVPGRRTRLACLSGTLLLRGGLTSASVPDACSPVASTQLPVARYAYSSVRTVKCMIVCATFGRPQWVQSSRSAASACRRKSIARCLNAPVCSAVA